MAEFINTIDALGDDAVIDSIIDRTITEFKDDKVTSVGLHAFRLCEELTEVSLPKATIVNGYGFYETGVRHVDLPSCTKLVDRDFARCSELESINLPKVETIGYGCFLAGNGVNNEHRPNKLEILDLPSCAEINSTAFSRMTRLTAIVLRANQVASLDNVNAFERTPITYGSGYIYVPSALVDGYKTATNWSTFADRIRAVEDYTVDGTLNGEFVNPVSYVHMKVIYDRNWAGYTNFEYIEVNPGTEITITSPIDYKLKAEVFDEQYNSLSTIGDWTSGTISGTLNVNAKYIKVTSKRVGGFYEPAENGNTVCIGNTVYIPVFE